MGLAAILVILFLLVGLRNPAFTTGSNALFILEDTAIMIILALGMLCVLLVGSIDISIAAVMALSTMTAGIVMKQGLVITETQALVDHLFRRALQLTGALLVAALVYRLVAARLSRPGTAAR